jgi:hypothetical protein
MNHWSKLSLCASVALLSATIGQAQALAPQNSTGLAGATPSVVKRTPPQTGGQRGSTAILVYDNNTNNQFAQQAAMNISPSGTVVATSSDFDSQLASQTWDVVAVDCPSSIPSAGWTALENYVAGGGKVVMSYWDWDAKPTLMAAFECQLASTFSLVGTTLRDSGTSGIFAGVTMPNSDWDDSWADDGDNFTPLGTAFGLGYVLNPSKPCMVMGNDGATIAAQVIDEAGATWQGDGSAVQLWENMINEVNGGPLTGDVDQISLSAGGQQVLKMNLTPTAALKSYQVLGTASGSLPGFPYTGTLIPLNPDAYTIFTLLNPNTPPLLNSAGVLDSSGKATIVFTLGAGTDPSLAGVLVHHAGVTLDLVGGFVTVSEATEAVSCLLVP